MIQSRPLKRKRQFRKVPRKVARPRLDVSPFSSMFQSEIKYFDSLLDDTAVATSMDWTGTELDPATLNTLFAPTEGSGISNRVGRKVMVKGIRIRGILKYVNEINLTLGVEPTTIRLIMFMDQQTNGTQAQGEQLMQPPATADADLVTLSMMNLGSLGRFRVLKDTTLTVQNPNTTYDGTNIETNGLNRTFKWNVSFKNPIEINFNATNGGTVADIVDNSFHIIAAKGETTSNLILSYYCRTSYIDR